MRLVKDIVSIDLTDYSTSSTFVWNWSMLIALLLLCIYAVFAAIGCGFTKQKEKSVIKLMPAATATTKSFKDANSKSKSSNRRDSCARKQVLPTVPPPSSKNKSAKPLTKKQNQNSISPKTNVSGSASRSIRLPKLKLKRCTGARENFYSKQGQSILGKSSQKQFPGTKTSESAIKDNQSINSMSRIQPRPTEDFDSEDEMVSVIPAPDYPAK